MSDAAVVKNLRRRIALGEHGRQIREALDLTEHRMRTLIVEHNLPHPNRSPYRRCARSLSVVAQIASLRQTMMPVDIARQVKLTPERVRQIIDQHGIASPDLTRPDKHVVSRALAANNNYRAVAAALGVSAGRLQTLIARYRLTVHFARSRVDWDTLFRRREILRLNAADCALQAQRSVNSVRRAAKRRGLKLIDRRTTRFHGGPTPIRLPKKQTSRDRLAYARALARRHQMSEAYVLQKIRRLSRGKEYLFGPIRAHA